MYVTNVDCVGCHLVPKMSAAASPFLGQTFKASEAACLGCHGDDFRGILGEWEKTVKGALAETRPAVEKAKAVATRGGKESRKAVQLAKDAEYNYLFVLRQGVHNPDYAVDVLRPGPMRKLSGNGMGRCSTGKLKYPPDTGPTMRFRFSPACRGRPALVAGGGTAFAHGYAGKTILSRHDNDRGPVRRRRRSLPPSPPSEAGEGEEPRYRETEISVGEFAKE
jgi:hypothetical protein